ncbi:hypothetical protein BST61_g3081 [Cercospora zeina]
MSRQIDRTVTTCRSCRRRKLKCDRGRPICARCRDTSSMCIYEEKPSRVAREYRFIGKYQTPGAAEATDAVDGSAGFEYDLLRKVQALLERLRTTVETLMPPMSLEATETNAGISTSSHTSAARQQSARRLGLWRSLREDASELHNVLSEAVQASCAGTASTSTGSAQSRTSVSSEGVFREIDWNASDWGGLEEFFPELQHPAHRSASLGEL